MVAVAEVMAEMAVATILAKAVGIAEATCTCPTPCR